jgi:hypothetical protein
MEIINLTINAIKQIKGPDYFRNEKKFITKFQSKLRQQLKGTDLFPKGTKLEIFRPESNPDYPGLRTRRVLVLHIPKKRVQHRMQMKIILWYLLSTLGEVQ